MNLTEKELGVVQVLLNDFNHHYIPRLLSIRNEVDSGLKLADLDLEFVEKAISSAKSSEDFVQHHPEFQTLLAEVAQLYHHITEKALENESK